VEAYTEPGVRQPRAPAARASTAHAPPERTCPESPRETTSPNLQFFSLGDEDFAAIEIAGDAPQPTAPAAPAASLSEAETRILAELVTGRSNREIAARRGTSLRTVTNQVSAVFRKLGVRSRSEVALLLAGGGVPRSDSVDDMIGPVQSGRRARRETPTRPATGKTKT
jgi:DNA-binding CsgD family transcriptional regulator